MFVTAGSQSEYELDPATYVGADDTRYMVKLGGVLLTGGAQYAYTVEAVTNTNPPTGKIVLSETPANDLELEVRSIVVKAAAVATSGTLAVPIREEVFVGTSISATQNLNLFEKQVYLFLSDTTANFGLNLRATVGQSLNSVMGIGESISTVLYIKIADPGHALTEVQIDGTVVTVLWQAASNTLSEGKMNIVSLLAIKTASDTYTVIGNVSDATEVV